MDQTAKINIAVRLAKDTETDSLILERLVFHPSWKVRIAALRNKSLPKSAIQRLLISPSIIDRKFLAYNKNTDSDTLKAIRDELEDSYMDQTRVAIARHPNANTSLLEKLSTDPDCYVRAEVAINPRSPKAVILKLSRDKNDLVRSYAGMNLWIPEKRLSELAEDGKAIVRRGVARNGNCPKAILKRLMKDRMESVKVCAKRTFEKRIVFFKNHKLKKIY